MSPDPIRRIVPLRCVGWPDPFDRCCGMSDTIPARDGLPRRGAPHGGGSSERLCGRVVSGVIGRDEQCCRKPAAEHIIWEDTADGVEQGFTCAEHVAETGARWKPLARHPLGTACGMPGAVWFREENVCGYEDGLPSTEPTRAVSLPVAA